MRTEISKRITRPETTSSFPSRMILSRTKFIRTWILPVVGLQNPMNVTRTTESASTFHQSWVNFPLDDSSYRIRHVDVTLSANGYQPLSRSRDIILSLTASTFTQFKKFLFVIEYRVSYNHGV